MAAEGTPDVDSVLTYLYTLPDTMERIKIRREKFQWYSAVFIDLEGAHLYNFTGYGTSLKEALGDAVVKFGRYIARKEP